jgi:hypothetical protein
MQAPEFGFLCILSLGGWKCLPKTCVCTHVVYTSVVGSNVEASGVSGYTHAHALTAPACMFSVRVSLEIENQREPSEHMG